MRMRQINNSNTIHHSRSIIHICYIKLTVSKRWAFTSLVASLEFVARDQEFLFNSLGSAESLGTRTLSPSGLCPLCYRNNKDVYTYKFRIALDWVRR